MQKDYNELAQKYRERLERELGGTVEYSAESREYKQFKDALMPHHKTAYEKLAKLFGFVHIKLPPEKEQKLQNMISVLHFEITPSDIIATSYILPVIFMFFASIISLLFIDSIFLAFFSIAFGLSGIVLLQKLPQFMADNWRMKASNQMVLCIFYVVTYMRHTSNLERAIEFASQHLGPPLALDMKKIMWDVETEKYENVRQSLYSYLQTWKDYNREFVESFHLIESSLYETSEERRLSLLDKALDVVLEETYEKMLHYAQNLKSPITMLHMLGVILPILGLVILPLIVSFMEDVRWWHIALIYNVTLPVAVYLLGKNILGKRPTGYGDSDVTAEEKKYENIIIRIGGKEILHIPPLIIPAMIGVAMILLSFSPLLVHMIAPDFDAEIGIDPIMFKIQDYHTENVTSFISGEQVTEQVQKGPFGTGATLISILFPLGLAFSIGLYYKLKSKNIIKIREQTKKLEDEFSNALFQLGNRLADGIPAEIAFEKVSEVMEGTVSGEFFKVMTNNIRKLGMGVSQALLDPKVGAIVKFPSPIIQSSMRVFLESIKKGPLITANALMNISRYIKEIHRVNERLQDLMADIISDMTSQIHFLTPAIAGIVIGITSMITYILGGLTSITGELTTSELGGNIAEIAGMFKAGIPTYYFQIVIGLYVFQIIYILTIMANGIQNGSDKLMERYTLGQNLITSTVLYCAISFIIIIIFNSIASTIITKALT